MVDVYVLGVFMKTEVNMERSLFGKPVLQKSKSEFLSATDLVKAGNLFRAKNERSAFNLAMWLKQQSTLEFIDEIKRSEEIDPVIKGRGRNAKTWVHPLLFIDIALALDPKLKIEVYKWLHDELLKYRNMSGDSYKKLSGAIYLHMDNKSEFPRYMSLLASKIKEICGVTDWQSASEKQLKLRDKIHNNVALLTSVLRDTNQAVELGIKDALKDQ
jgi:hypothetical protein